MSSFTKTMFYTPATKVSGNESKSKTSGFKSTHISSGDDGSQWVTVSTITRGPRSKDSRHRGPRSKDSRPRKQTRQKKSRSNGQRKKMLCTDHAAFQWGLSGCSCSKGSNRCGFAHQLSHQIIDPENHRINTLIKKATSSKDKTLLESLELTADMIEHFSRRSHICRRFLSCLKKLENKTLQKSDLCPGGANCKGGICGDTYKFDWSKSLLLDKRDWMYGESSGYGIQLTKYGLVPLNVQRQRVAKAAAIEESLREQERVKKMISSSESFPSLGSSICAKPSLWGKSKDWLSITANANELEATNKAKKKKELAKEREYAATVERTKSYDSDNSYSYSDSDDGEYLSNGGNCDEEAYYRFDEDVYDDEW